MGMGSIDGAQTLTRFLWSICFWMSTNLGRGNIKENINGLSQPTPTSLHLEAMASRLEAIGSRLEAIAIEC